MKVRKMAALYGNRNRAAKRNLVMTPSNTWSTAAEEWLTVCQNELETNTQARRLLAQRFLTLDTCRAAGIGWNPRKTYADRAAWGLPPGASGGDKLVLPAGLVLPVRRAGRVVGLTVRCSDPSGPRYRDISGGAVLPFGVGQAGRSVMLVESVLDACLCWQESCGQIAAVATFGSGKGFDEQCTQFIQKAPQVFLCPDADTAGIDALFEWQELFPSAKEALVPCVQGVGDPTELQRAALTLPLDESIPTVAEWLAGLLGGFKQANHVNSPACPL